MTEEIRKLPKKHLVDSVALVGLVRALALL